MSFKQLTADNWLEPDPTLEAVARFDLERGVAEPLSGQHIAEEFLSVSLPQSVPKEIRQLFEAARVQRSTAASSTHCLRWPTISCIG